MFKFPDCTTNLGEKRWLKARGPEAYRNLSVIDFQPLILLSDVFTL